MLVPNTSVASSFSHCSCTTDVVRVVAKPPHATDLSLKRYNGILKGFRHWARKVLHRVSNSSGEIDHFFTNPNLNEVKSIESFKTN